MNKHEPIPTMAIVYFIVWAVLAIGTTILFRVRRDAEFRIRWRARISLIVIIVIAIFMALVVPSWRDLPFIAVGAGFFIYLNLTKITICKRCGKIIQPVRLFQRAKVCPHCGGETVLSKLRNSR